MKVYDEIEFGTKSKEGNCVFLWIYANNCDPYKGYDDELVNVSEMSMVLSQLRWDGLFGATAGGTVELGESIQDALVREVWEEINFDLDISECEPLATYALESGTHIHSYSLEVSYSEVKEIMRNATLGKHYSAEILGMNLLPISNYTKHNGSRAGLVNILEQKFICTSKQEFEKLLQKLEIKNF